MSSRLAHTVHRIAYASGLSPFLTRRGAGMRILMLHGVGEARMSAARLEAHLVYLRRRLEPVSLAEVVRRAGGERPITGREVAVTFDDGLKSHASLAVPLLVRHGIPATFFVCPGLVEEGRWLWNHEARARIESLPTERRAAVLADAGLPETAVARASVGTAVNAMKRLAYAERRDVEARLRAATPSFAATPEQRRRYDLVSWADLRALPEDLVSIGSHTLTHPLLPTLPAADLTREVADSRRQLEAGLGRTVEHFCYPNGAEDDRVRAEVAATYRAAVTTVPGIVRAGADPYRLARIGASEPTPTLAWRLLRP